MEYYGTQDVICPFYVNENKNNIICLGLTDGMETVRRFDTPTNKKIYKINYCERFGHMDCPYYKILDEIRYKEENNMSKSLEEKLESATKYIKELKKQKTANERALKYQVDWREAELKKQKAKVVSTEMLTKYLVDKVAEGEELRIPINELSEYSEKYDVISVYDKENNEIVCNLYDKQEGKFLDENYNDYLDYVNQLIHEVGKGNLYGDYIRVKNEENEEERKKIIEKSLNIVKASSQKVKFPQKIKKKLKLNYKVFAQHKGSMIVAWFAVNK